MSPYEPVRTSHFPLRLRTMQQPGRPLKPHLHRQPWKARQRLHLHHLHRKGLRKGRHLRPSLMMLMAWKAWKAWMMGIMTRIGCLGAEVDCRNQGRQLGPRQFVKVAGHGGPQLKPMVCLATVHCCPPKRMDYFPAKTASQWLQWLLTALGLFGLEKQETTEGCSKLCN